MIAIGKLSPGMLVYDVRSVKAGNTNLSTVRSWPVLIVSVDIDRSVVIARWNWNPERSFYARRGKLPWRKEDPVLVRHGWVWRLETKEEKAARVAKEKSIS